MSQEELPEHFFRREYSNLIAVLTRRFGAHQIEIIEDAVQNALVKSLEQWTYQGVPENPSGWLFTVAKNNLLNDLRNHSNRKDLMQQYARDTNPGSGIDRAQELEPSYFLSREINDDLLNLLFLSCDANLPIGSQIAFTLRALCGFSIDEISQRLFISKQNAYKRLQRAKKKLACSDITNLELSLEEKSQRLSTVLKVIYLIFTEGYFSSNNENAIRQELCEEALRLGDVLANNKLGQKPSCFALLALMNFHYSRFSTRQDSGGGLFLLEEQDRLSWNVELIQKGLFWLSKSAEGDEFTRYHAEAGVAAEYCLAESYSSIRWNKVVENYELLESFNPSPLHLLNRVVAISEWKGAKHALAVLAEFDVPKWLSSTYIWEAVLAFLFLNVDRETSHKHIEAAIKSAPSEQIKALLKKRFNLENI